MQSLKAVVAAFQSGQMSREDFWRGMQQRHIQFRNYQDLIAGTDVDSIDIRGDELRVRTRDGVSMIWDPEDMGTAPNVLVNYGLYEAPESTYLLDSGAGAHVIFDIGANVGYFSLRWASRLAHGGIIHAFEPVPATFSRLSRNIAINHLEAIVQPNNIGLGQTPSTLSLFVPDFTGCGAASMMNLHPDETSREVEVNVDTLDRYFAASGLNRLDLIKIDVEGAELLVLQGGRDTIAAHRPLLFMELLRKWSKPFGYHPNDVLALLAEIGYRCYTFGDNCLIPFQLMDDNTTQKNFFFAHPEVHQSWLSAHHLA
jgi:FkbM family methyltransferase